MKVKKYLHPEKKEKKLDHTNHFEQDAKGPRHVPRGTFVKTVPMMFFKNTTDTNTISA
jgi:hypothetical protein